MSSLGRIFKIKKIFVYFQMKNLTKKKFYDVIQLFIHELIYYILNKNTNSSKIFHNSINRNNSIEQQVNYDKSLKKKRKY